jgi:hypothetical protein
VNSEKHAAVVDRKSEILEKEEMERLEEEELDIFFLKNICSEIMDEVMIMMSYYLVTDPKGESTGRVKNITNTTKIKGIF